jgi:hypothetical protein
VLTVNNKEVALVYYRWGYDDSNYCKDDNPEETDEAKWDVRTLLECSLAIKLPSIDG